MSYLDAAEFCGNARLVLLEDALQCASDAVDDCAASINSSDKGDDGGTRECNTCYEASRVKGTSATPTILKPSVTLGVSDHLGRMYSCGVC